MNENIQKLLDELLSFDPELKSREQELKVILEKMFAQKPDVQMNAQFVKELREKILQSQTQKSSFVFNLSSMLKQSYAVGAAVIAGVLVLGAAIFFTQNPRAPQLVSAPGKPLASTVLPANAFGKLGASPVASPLGSPEAMSSRMPASLGGNGMAVQRDAAVAESAVVTNPAPMAASVSDMAVGKMIAPYYSYGFVYTGEPLTFEETTLPVYNRIKNLDGKNIASTFANFSNGMVDLSQFRDAKVQTVTLFEDRSDGYFVNIDFLNASININPQYEKWYPNICKDGVCEEPKPLTEKDLLDDETLIRIANEFLSDYGIDQSKYGAPKVNNNWRQYQVMPLMERSSIQPAYTPDVITVVYPVTVGGQVIIDGSGEAFGLGVNVDLRKKKVQSVWNLTTEQYEQSEYMTETDSARIIKIAESGMLGGWYGGSEENKKLNLGTPEKIYTQHYQYSGEQMTSIELYIPALRFPILNPPADQPYFQKFVVVPLVKEILDQYDIQENPQPMPFIRILEKPVLEDVAPDPAVSEPSVGIMAPPEGTVTDPDIRY